MATKQSHLAQFPEAIPEASSLEMSELYPNTLYHTNDSGDGAYIYKTDFRLSKIKKLKITKHKARDFEDMSLWNDGASSYLVVGDIGDNWKVRKSVQLLVIPEEQSTKNSQLVTSAYLDVRYPQTAENAEALAVHPNGDIYILTKDYNKTRNKHFVSKLFYIPKSKWMARGGNQSLQWEEVAQWDFMDLIGSQKSIWGYIPTGMDFNKAGDRLIVLTYKYLIELNWPKNPNKTNLAQLNSLLRFKVKTLKQPKQEAVCYGPNDSVLYSSETNCKGKGSLIELKK